MPSTPQPKGRASFVLENAALKKGLVGKRWKILNAEEDMDFLCRKEKNLDEYRPDILHEALRTILDSPLNKVGKVGAVYVRIAYGKLFEVKPQVRLPRTLNRFCGIMLDLLEKSSVRTKDTNEVLLRIIDEPLSKHFPANSHLIGLSHGSEKQVDIDEYVSAASDNLNMVFMVGAMVHGKVNKE